EQRGWPGPVVLPREELVVVDPRCAGRRLLLAHEREIRDRQQPLPLPAPPVAIAERIELLDVADPEPGLVTHPAPPAPLERRVAEWIERTGWNREACAAGADREQLRPIVGDGDDHRLERQRDRRPGQRTLPRRRLRHRFRLHRGERPDSLVKGRHYTPR